MARPRTIGGRARVVAARLEARYPGTAAELCALNYTNPYELLAATILSAQCTDVRVNLVTPELFARYPSVHELAVAEVADVETIIRSTGFFRAKTASLIGMANAIVDRFGGVVPRAREDLVTLPGVGRKTANVVRSVAFDLPGLPVDTHVGRIVRRLGLSQSLDPVVVETEIGALLPARRWGAFSIEVILLGREICVARTPRCVICPLNDLCPSAHLAPVAPTRRRAAPGAR